MSDVSYTIVEAALVSTLITDLSLFNTSNLKAGDFDSVFLNALADNDEYIFAWTDFAGGANQGRMIWQHLTNLNVGIQFRGQNLGVETMSQMVADIRTVVDALLSEMLSQNKLGGAVVSSSLLGIGDPEAVLNEDGDIIYIQVSFNIAMEEEMPRC